MMGRSRRRGAGQNRSDTNVRVLIVEDNELNRDMLTRRLTRRGLAVTCAADGLEGIRLATEQPPDVILMDIGLPVIDGWEVIRRLKAAEKTRPIPIVALTAHVLIEDQERAFAAGCAGFVAKPIDMDALLSAIDQAAEGSGDHG
jgi:two-component system, cell cycle response regulator DivK